MTLIDGLLGEHAALYTFFDYIQKFVAGWSLPQAKHAGSFLESVLSPHARLEDELLFDSLSPKSSGMVGTLAAMRAEHQHLAAAFGALQEVDNVERARYILQYIVDVAREHFAVEERVLFNLAEEELGTQALTELGAEWARRRQLKLFG